MMHQEAEEPSTQSRLGFKKNTTHAAPYTTKAELNSYGNDYFNIK